MGFLCRHCGNTFERLERMEMHSERCWKANKAHTFCNCLMMRGVECNCFEEYSELNKRLLKEKEIKEAERLKQEKFDKMKEECNCTLCFCYRTKKHIDLCDMQAIIDDVKMGNPVSECLERLYRDEVNQDFYKCYGPTEKDDNCKKQLHPGKVANDLLVIKGYRGASSKDMASPTLCGDILSMNSAFLEEFFCGYVDICHDTAYKLAKVIEGTDVRFWMELQEKYDAYIQKNK